jgi:hypothetical protein
MRAVFLYHADAELDRVLAIAIAVSLGALAAITVLLIAVAPRKPGHSRRAAGIALALAGAGIVSYLALGVIPWSDSEEPPVVWWTLFLLVAAAFLLAPVPAFRRTPARKAGLPAGQSV